MTDKHNILVVQADQLTALCLGAYGKPLAKTPNINKIAEKTAYRFASEDKFPGFKVGS